jgi:hypothetical protein
VKTCKENGKLRNSEIGETNQIEDGRKNAFDSISGKKK